MTKVLFAGAHLSRDGIKLNLDKVSVILDWPEPINVLQLMGFLGLVGSYWGLIMVYARIVQPLTNLTRHLSIPVVKHPGQPKRGALECGLEGTLITYEKLKYMLATEPVLKFLVYDSRVFVITTNRAKLGFKAVLPSLSS